MSKLIFYSNIHINDLDGVMDDLNSGYSTKKWVVGVPKETATYSELQLIELGYKGVYETNGR